MLFSTRPSYHMGSGTVAEFAYNHSVNQSTRISPFDAVTDIRLRLPVDLVPLPAEARTSVNADTCIRHMQQVHEEVQHHISTSNDAYKHHVDKHRRFIQVAEGDMVMVRNRPKSLPPGANKKLYPRNSGLFKILKKIGPNACVRFAIESWIECYIKH